MSYSVLQLPRKEFRLDAHARVPSNGGYSAARYDPFLLSERVHFPAGNNPTLPFLPFHFLDDVLSCTLTALLVYPHHSRTISVSTKNASTMPPITLHFLQASRSIRIAWLLSELNLDYAVNFANRKANMKAPEEFKISTGNPLGKAPSLKDGDITICESGAITEYDLATWIDSKRFLNAKKGLT